MVYSKARHGNILIVPRLNWWCRHFSDANTFPQFLTPPEVFQRFPLGWHLDILLRLVVHDVVPGQFDDLARLGARDVLHLHDHGRHMARGRVVPDPFLEALDQRPVDGVTFVYVTTSTTRTSSPLLRGGQPRPMTKDSTISGSFSRDLSDKTANRPVRAAPGKIRALPGWPAPRRSSPAARGRRCARRVRRSCPTWCAGCPAPGPPWPARGAASCCP